MRGRDLSVGVCARVDEGVPSDEVPALHGVVQRSLPSAVLCVCVCVRVCVCVCVCVMEGRTLQLLLMTLLLLMMTIARAVVSGCSKP